ncbi:MAG: hypothetical protein KKC21_06085 [Nitrospinae bacterium]|nr:hypothetical protein [Nitrospinota bacterium]
MDDYEASNPNDASETNMDLWNNEQGRQIGEEALNDWTNLLDPDIGQRVNDKLQKGDLITDTSDLRKWVEPPPGGIFQNIQDFIDSTIDEIGGKIGEFYNDLVDLSDIVQIVSDSFNTAIGTALPVVRRDPLILDLDGDGTETIGVDAGAYFDHDANGFAEQIGWASPDDGLLVLDRNNDGLINNGRELFGDNTLLKSGAIATDGLQALADLDDNGDGKIDINDAAFAELKVWQDTNSDGISAAEELHTMEELGIKSLNTTYTTTNITHPSGNIQTHAATYETTDGFIHQMGNFLVERDMEVAA